LKHYFTVKNPKKKKNNPEQTQSGERDEERERETEEELTGFSVGGRSVAWVFTLSLTVSLFFIVFPLLLLYPDQVYSKSSVFFFLVWDGKCNVSKLLLGVRMVMGRYGSGFASPRLDPTRLDIHPKKTRLLPRPPVSTGTNLTRPDRYPTRPDFFFFLKDFFNQVLQIWSTWSSINRWIGSDQTTIIGHLAQLNPNKI
jgi:hypothetical protein